VFPIADFPVHAAAWRAINSAVADNPALDPDFVMPLLDHFGNPRARLCICGDLREPLAMTIVAPSKLVTWQTLQPAQAPIGLWLARRGLDMDSLVSALLSTLPGAPLLIGLSQLDPENIPASISGGLHIQMLDYIQTGRITVNGSFDDYWAARGKNLRHNLKRQTNRMATDGLVGQLDVLTAASDMAAAVNEYGRIETAGWKAGEGTAIAQDNTQGRFYRAILERFAARGAARVFRYRLGAKTAAVDLCVEQGGTLIILKTTYDESINGYSPAMLMRQEVFRRIFADGGVRRIEFYGKVMEWHTKWTKEFRTMYHLNCYRFGLISRLLKRDANATTT
jgi:CelD/BcsL family acetyltransferase involved in cellulose biosynthesis